VGHVSAGAVFHELKFFHDLRFNDSIMSNFFDDALVGLVLLISAGYAVWSLGPSSLRQSALAALGRLASRAPRGLGLGRMSQRLSDAAASKAKGACGGCDNCGTAQASTTQASTTPSGVAEIKIPVGKIGRRGSGAARRR
jgi:hypothetical protein